MGSVGQARAFDGSKRSAAHTPSPVARTKLSGSSRHLFLAMALSVREMQQRFPDWDGSDSESSVCATRDEVADRPAHGVPVE
jgi:hypothetical protein